MRVLLQAGRPYTSALIAFVAGCSGGRDASAPTATVRDSAGIEIVENTARAWRQGEECRISAEPMLEIGAEDGAPEYEFGQAHGPVRLTDGRIVVADMQSNQMKWFDASGRYLMSAGRTGGGPGEFEQLYRLRKIGGDSLMALNPASLTSIFTSEGEYVRRFDLDPVRNRGNLWWRGQLSDGTLLALSLQREGTREIAPPADARPGVEHARLDIPEQPPFYRDSLLHFLFTMEGQLIDSIGELPGQWIGRERALVPNAAYAFFGDAFFHSPGDVVEVRTFRSLARRRAAGTVSPETPHELIRLERVVRRVPLRDLTVTEADKQAYIAEQRAMYEGIARGSVIDTAGIWLGIVETPPQFTVYEIGADYLLGTWRDSMDVQYVRMYRLEKPEVR
jgi:hypothetical protein